MGKKETYEIDKLCMNCSNIVVIKIPKGTTKEDYFYNLKNRNCPNCGCRML